MFTCLLEDDGARNVIILDWVARFCVARSTIETTSPGWSRAAADLQTSLISDISSHLDSDVIYQHDILYTTNKKTLMMDVTIGA